MVGRATPCALPPLSSGRYRPTTRSSCINVRQFRFGLHAEQLADPFAPRAERQTTSMRKHTSLYYLLVLGIALAFAYFTPKQASRDKAGAAPNTVAAQEAPHASDKPATQTDGSGAPANANSGAKAHVQPLERTFEIETPEYRARVSSLNGGLKSVVLKDKQFQRDGRAADVVTTEKPSYYPLAFQLQGVTLPEYPAWEWQSLGTGGLRMSTEANGIAIDRKLEVGKGPYQIWITTTLHNRDTSTRKLTVDENTYHYVSRAAESGNVPLLPARSIRLATSPRPRRAAVPPRR